MTTKRGDIVLVMFPDSDLRTAKLRPALVVQANNLNSGLAQTVVTMISSNLRRAGHPSRVQIQIASPAGKQTGLHADSVILTDNMRTVLDSGIRQKIGVWPDMPLVDAALRHTLAV